MFWFLFVGFCGFCGFGLFLSFWVLGFIGFVQGHLRLANSNLVWGLGFGVGVKGLGELTSLKPFCVMQPESARTVVMAAMAAGKKSALASRSGFVIQG